MADDRAVNWTDIPAPTPRAPGVGTSGCVGSARDRRAGRILNWSAAVLAVLLLAVTLLALYLLRVDMLERGAQETQADARLIAEQTARTFQTVDQRLQLTAVELARRQGAEVLDAATAQQLLRLQIQAQPYVQATWTLDVQGRVEFSSQNHMTGLDQSGSDLFQIYQRDPTISFLLGKPRRNADTGAWQIDAARPLRGADGTLRGVIVASVTTGYFLDLWTNTLPVAHSVSVLFHRDGTLLMRSPHDEAQVGRDRSDLALFTRRLVASPHGDMRTVAPLDGVDRLLSYRSLDSGLPLVLVVGRSVDSILAPWRRTAAVALSTYAAACGVILVVLLRLRGLSRQRARADDQVRQAELDREQVFARISDAFVALDTDWRYTHVNAQAGDMFGRDSQSLIGKHIWTEFPEGRGQKFHLLYEQAMAEQKPLFVEEYYPPYDRWFENRIYPAPDGLSIYFHDITDRKKAEQALQARERRLRRLIDGMGPAIFVALTTRDGLLEQLNQAGESAAGKPLADLLGVPVHMLDGLSYATVVQEKVRDAIAEAADGVAARFDISVRFAGGALRMLDLSVQPMRDDSDIVDHIVLCASDITDRTAAETALRDSEELFRGAFASGDLGMAIVDVDGRLVRVNPAFCRIVGYEESEMLQMQFQDITHVDDLPAGQARIAAMNEGSQSHIQSERRYRRKDGTLVWCKLNTATVNDAHGEPQYHVTHIEDISHHRLLADKLRRSEARLRATLDALPDLLFEVDGMGTYHDFHSPRQDLLVVAPEKFIGTRVPDMLPPDVSDQIMDGIGQALAKGYSKGQRYRLSLPGGVRWFELSCARKATMPDEGERAIVLSRDISDRVQFEQSLRYNEELLLQMAETISQVFWLADMLTQQFLYASPSFEPLLGFPAQATLDPNNAWLQSIHPEDRALVSTQQALLLATGSYDMQFRVCPPGQEQRWIHARAYPIRDRGGKLYRSAGVMDDITWRKLLEIREDNERQVLQCLNSDAPMNQVLTQIIVLYELLLPGMVGSILLLDEAGQHLHHGAASNLSRAYRDAIDEIAMGPRVGSRGAAAFAGETVIVPDIATDPLWADHKDLALSHGLRACWSVPIKGTSGRVLGTVAFYFGQIRTPNESERATMERAAQLVGQPIERALAARQLRVSEERYRALVEWSPLGIAVHQGGVVVYANPACVAIFGARSAEQLQGRDILDLIVPREQEAAKERIARILAGENTDLIRRQYYRLDGGIVVLEGKAAPITINGEPAVQFSVRDVTDELAAQTALVDSRQQLRVLSSQVLHAQEAERRRIAHELHDELGQSLTAIKINLLAGQRAAPGGETAIAAASENIRIVESALAHVRGLSLALRPSMLDDLGLLPALRWLAGQLEQRNELMVHLRAPSKPQRFAPDLETACFRIVQEATTNIVRHAHASNVNIELRVEDGALELTIRDDGIGFDVAAMRARATLGGSVGVLGMQERASLVGGHLVISSAPGAGSVVRLSCRLNKPDPASVLAL